jgi:NTP pyrophosphatase (non-canonical NTP hydrolase)
MMTINELVKEAHSIAISKGFYKATRSAPELLMLLVTEAAEAVNAHREDKTCVTSIQGVTGWVAEEDFKRAYTMHVKGTFEDELADIAIRLFDICGYYEIDLETHIRAKMRYNRTRPMMNGKKY